MGREQNPAITDTQSVLRLAEDSIATGSQSFAAAARLFKPDRRADAVMLYAWCRHADDVIDGQDHGHDQQRDFRTGQRDRLNQLRAQTHAALAGDSCGDPVFEALRQVVGRNHIPHRHPQELLAGFAMDVDERRYRTIDDTLDYCYHVAGVVGIMMAMIMGARDDSVLDRASDLGLAFQLTNIARDIIDDARTGRCYLPQEWLDEFGLIAIDPEDRAQWPALHRLAGRLLDTAEPYYRSALSGLSALDFRSAWAVASARRIYRDIGRKLLNTGPTAWESRVSTSKFRKFLLILSALGDVLRSRMGRSEHGPARAGLYLRPMDDPSQSDVKYG